MWEFETAQTFIENAKRASDLDGLAREFGGIVRQMGFERFTCVSHVDFADPPDNAITIIEFPENWVDRYTSEHYERYDRVLKVAFREAVPFSWDEDSVQRGLTKIEHQVFDEANEVDIVHGYTIPIHTRGALPASVNVVGPTRDIDARCKNALHLMGVYLHDAALRILATQQAKKPRTARILTQRERECLKWVSVGKTDWEISQILTIRARTAHFHVENAKRKLGTSTRVQAVVQAFLENQIILS